jgi:hypothetical protein
MSEVLLVLHLSLAMAPTLNMRRIALVDSNRFTNVGGHPIVCYDSDHDSLPELIFCNGTIHPIDPLRLEVWEHQGWNRFRLVHVDTGDWQWFYPYRIAVGNAVPLAAGDIDRDGLTDVVCVTWHCDTAGAEDTLFTDLITIESPDRSSYPCSLSWYCSYDTNQAPTVLPVYYPPDLDGDGHREILLCGSRIWENVSDDSNELVWRASRSGLYCAVGDFDADGRMDLATGGGYAEVWENIGDDQYERVYKDTTILPGWGPDVFATSDIDRDGRPEFYVSCFNYPLARMWLCMYEDEGDGSHQFTRTLVDSLTFRGGSVHTHGAAGDIDGDGVDECIWVTPDSIRCYKAFGNNDLREVWHWISDHSVELVCTVYDLNNDGYNELVLAGRYRISIFEVEAVTLLSPNSGTYGVGDTVEIRAAVNTPPRCDSLSLFLRRDSLWHLSTIATGLPSTDTVYRWVVPTNVPDTGRIVVMAYGPGWQFDMSDSVIHFIGGGVAEGTRNVPLQWSLSVSPNPARGPLCVRYDVPRQARVSVGIYDVDGRLAKSLSEGEISPGRYEAKLPAGELPAGIYFLRLDAPGFRSVKKAVVTR